MVTTSPTGITIEDGELMGINIQTLSETPRSATYEGLYGGIAYRF